jgi:hypothetical protein
MSQDVVLRILEKNKRPMSRLEITNELEIYDITSISKTIRKLLLHNEIKCKEISRTEAKELFGDKAPYRRMRLYYL